MPSRPAVFVLVSVKVNKEKHFRLTLPVPVFLVYSLTEMILDITDFAALFVPKKARRVNDKHSSVSFHTVHSSIKCADLLIKSAFTAEVPWELCDVDTDGIKVKIKLY